MIRHYDMTEDLWVADRATRGAVRTTFQARHMHQQQRLEDDLNDQMEYIPEEPSFEGGSHPSQPSPIHMDEYSPGPTQFVPFVPSGSTSGSRGSKRKASMVDLMDSQFEKLTTKLDDFMDVMRSSNCHFEKISCVAEHQVIAFERRNDILTEQVGMMKRNATFQYTERNIWEMLVQMNIHKDIIMD